MATITQLPDDLILIILENEILNMEDIVNFMSTCKRFQQITLSYKFWEKRYYQRCYIAQKNNGIKPKKFFHDINFKQILHYIQEIQDYTIKMSEHMLNKTDIKQLESSLRSIAENSMIYYIVLDEMNRFSVQKPCKLFSNLTYEYNFKLIFSCLKQYRFVHKQMKFMNLPEAKLLLEKQLTILAKCFQPRVSYSVIDTWLNNVTQTVLSCLKNKHPSHLICSTALEQFSFWRDNNIDKSFWNETESTQIMCVLREYIYSELKFHELHELLMTFDFEAEYIRSITEYFRASLLTITYHIVARRLGICSLLETNKIDIEVKWSPSFRNRKNKYSCSRTYVNPYPSQLLPVKSNNYNWRFSKDRCIIHLNYLLVSDLPCIELTREILMYFFNKFRYDHKMHIKWNFKLFNFLWQHFLRTDFITKKINIEIEYKKITKSTIEVKSKDVNKSVNRRTEDVKFAVGMIVTHSHDPNSDDRDGVIIGWHHNYDKWFLVEFLEELYKTNIFTCVCSETNDLYRTALLKYYTDKKLYYIILTENNNICYVHQSMILTSVLIKGHMCFTISHLISFICAIIFLLF
ncbi:uncharacterized protein LOC126858655 [Cataglyphis hispanica]|uniref:uncharacterized protein LOC126858655 n=1 Tax=Cataglyphis hispanica TaxID=1086592 RepID=UPI00217FBAE5|nr:uncharacterized protein LOC126858655 [Cataglyphis hispanica]